VATKKSVTGDGTTATATASTKDELSFILFKGFLYPSSNEDYDYLKQRACTSYRFPVAVLPALRKTRLTKAKVKIIPFIEMWKPFMEHLETELENYGTPTITSAHGCMLLFKTVAVEKVRAFARKLDMFTRRYCIRLDLQIKNRQDDGLSLAKFSFIYNEEINNSYAYMGKTPLSVGDESMVEISLASSVKLRMSRNYVNNIPTFQVVVLDKAGDSWSEALNRTGIAGKMPKDAFEKAAMFLLEMC
jgi:hypothetical protein